MIEHERKQNTAGNDVVIVEVNVGGGGKFYEPELIRVAEIERGTEYTKINAKNVIKDISAYEFNHFGGRGPDSNYGACRASADADLEQATAGKSFEFEKGDDEKER
jgi:hypothetical protein